MLFLFLGLLVAPIFASKGAAPQRLKPQCRANVCDDRPECPKSSCRCLFPSRMDCAVYYQCVNGKPFQYKCSPGLLFNEDTLSCDYSYKVNCSFSTTVDSSPFTEIMNTTSSVADKTVDTTIVATSTIKVETTTTAESTKNDITTTEAPYTPKAVTTSNPTSETETKSSENTSESSSFSANITTEISTSEITTTEQITERISTTTSMSTPRIPDTSIDTESSIITISTILPTTHYTTENETSPSQNLTTIPPTEFVCPSRFGLFPDPNSCFRFYQCSHWIPYLKWCPSGLHFNPTLQVCDWPYRAGCDNSNGTDNPNTTKTTVSSTVYTTPKETSSPEPLTNTPPSQFICPSRFGLFADPKSCFRFYHCSHWIPYHKWCPSDLHFNTRLQVCDWPYRAGCDSPTVTPPHDDTNSTCDACESCFIPDKDDCSAYTYCLNGTSYRLQCTGNLLFNPKTEACDGPENVDCNSPTMTPPHDDTNSTCDACESCYIPDKDDCSAYTYCLNGTSYRVQCTGNLLFNPKTEACDRPENVDCNRRPDEPTTTDNGDDVFNRTCDCECCFLPSTKDCSRYFLCLDGYLHEGQCSSGLLFNPSIQNCDIAERVNCEGDTPLCPEPNGYFPNPDQCTSFVQCWNGIPRLERCQNGTHFSAQKKQCLDPCEAKCNGSYDCSTTSSPVISSSTQPPICEDPDGIYPSSKDCTSYYVCSDGIPYAVRCPPGYHYSVEYEACIEPCDAKCDLSLDCGASSSVSTSTVSSSVSTSTVSSSVSTSPSTISSNCPDGQDGLFPSKDDCSSFYQCYGGRSYLMKCPKGLDFSFKDQVCENPCVANCNDTIDCSPPTTPKTDTSTPSSHCPTAEGLYPVVGDCTAFYLCGNGKEHVIHCPPGLHFSKGDETCENPCDARCDFSIDCKSSTRPESSTTIQPISPECEATNGLFSNPHDCGSFYQCSNGRSHLIQCPNGLHFSLDDAACERPCVAGCDLNIKCPDEIPDTESNCSCNACYLPDENDCSAFYFCGNGSLTKGYCPFGTLFEKTSSSCQDENTVDCEANGDPSMCPEPSGFFPYPGDCKKFLHCDHGVAHIKQCEGDLEYDPQNKVCTKPQGYCGDTALDPHCLQPTGLFPDPENCNGFYQCENGVAYHKLCSQSLMFNPKLEVCDWPENTDCGRDITRGPSTDSSLSTGPHSNYSSQSSTQSTLTPSDSLPVSSTSEPCHEVPGVICPCACRVPTYDDCSSFLQCQEDGTACKKYCPEGLYFNKHEMVCDLPSNLECRDFFFGTIRRTKLLSHL